MKASHVSILQKFDKSTSNNNNNCIKNKKVDNKSFKKLCDVRKAYDESGNLITALHYILSLSDKRYKNLLPPLTKLKKEEQKKLLDKLKKLSFFSEKNIAA